MKKAINFDLNTKALKEHYPSKNYRNGYKDIEKFLMNNGFKHRQWSGYISVKPISHSDIIVLIAKMNKELPWMKKCVNRFDVTEVSKQYDMAHLFIKNTDVPEKTTERVTEEKPKQKPFTIGKKSILNAKQQNKDTQQKQPTKKKEHTR